MSLALPIKKGSIMIKFTVTPAADADLAGIPAVITGINKETGELILRFEDGSSHLFARKEHLTTLEREQVVA